MTCIDLIFDFYNYSFYFLKRISFSFMTMTDRYFFEISTLDDTQNHDFDNDNIRHLFCSISLLRKVRNVFSKQYSTVKRLLKRINLLTLKISLSFVESTYTTYSISELRIVSSEMDRKSSAHYHYHDGRPSWEGGRCWNFWGSDDLFIDRRKRCVRFVVRTVIKMHMHVINEYGWHVFVFLESLRGRKFCEVYDDFTR